MKRGLIALVAAVVLMGLVVAVTDLDLGAVKQTLAGLALAPCLLAFGVYACTYLGRGLRLGVLLKQPPRLLHLASISARHNFFNLVLPFRSGEATLPLMLKSEAGHSLAEGSASLFVCRVLDLFSVTTFLLLGLALRPDPAQPSLVPRIVLVLALIVAALFVLRRVAAIAAVRISRQGRLRSFLAHSTEHLAAVPFSRLGLATLVSLLTWLLTYTACWLLIVAMSDPDATAGSVPALLAAVDFPTSLVGTTGLHLTAILPVNTPAGVGAWEAGWTAGYVLAGVDQLAAAASAVGTHVLIFGFIAVLGALSMLLRPTPFRSGPKAEML